MEKKPNQNMLNNDLEKRIAEIENQIKMLTDHLLLTREMEVLKTESLPFIQYQIRRLLFELDVQQRMLADVQDELGLRFQSFQAAKRQLSRTQEENMYYRKYMDTVLQSLQSLKDENEKLRTENEQLKQQLEARRQIIEGYEKVQTEIARLLEKRRLPTDVTEELTRILKEEGITPPPSPPKPPLKEKVEEEEEEEELIE